ncbi:hypothetical protein DAPPUDRAFT_238134 [Daphnia pulex]|uniref:Uncharacterized protein n=1 Tax=Daphnia pulex TaxID=6669 RepID=E9G6Q6_DAPPU|nr:hypothetical protein DAPPUDRAFT_238134 [Daphnia pulex]|eukprot:EFX84786.1 hypothetical protein DAPPUDRAFT_238134 [Daphnia pulex]
MGTKAGNMGMYDPSPATSTCGKKGQPIPSNENLQKGRHVTLEGHGEKRVMQRCRGWVRTDVLHHYQAVNYGVVLLLCCIFDGLVDHWCTDVSLLWGTPKRNAAALLHDNNIRNSRLLAYCISKYYTT